MKVSEDSYGEKTANSIPTEGTFVPQISQPQYAIPQAYVAQQPTTYIVQQQPQLIMGAQNVIIENIKHCSYCNLNVNFVERSALHLVVFIVLLVLFWPAALCMLCCCRSRVRVCANCNSCDNRGMYFCIE